VARLDGHCLWSFDFHNASIPIFDMNLAMGEKCDVRVLAQIAPD